MSILRIAKGKSDEFTKFDAIKAAITEFICTLTFVFPAEGCALLFGQIITPTGLTIPLITASLSHGFAICAAVAIGVNISGSHVNPAITFAALVGGHITFVRSIMYWIAQLLGSLSAVYILKIATNGLKVAPFPPEFPLSAVIFEITMTFLLAYTYYATVFDPKRSKMKIISPIAIGLIVAANILCGGASFGAAMNPAIAFAQATISWKWTNHWVYWVGNFIGAPIAALVYQTIFIDLDTEELLPTTNYIKI